MSAPHNTSLWQRQEQDLLYSAGYVLLRRARCEKPDIKRAGGSRVSSLMGSWLSLILSWDVCFQKKACAGSKSDELVSGWAMFSCHGVEGPAGLIRSAEPDQGAIPSSEVVWGRQHSLILCLGDGGTGWEGEWPKILCWSRLYMELSHCLIHFSYAGFRKLRLPEWRSECYWVFSPYWAKPTVKFLLCCRSGQEEPVRVWMGMGLWLIADLVLYPIVPGGHKQDLEPVHGLAQTHQVPLCTLHLCPSPAMWLSLISVQQFSSSSWSGGCCWKPSSKSRVLPLPAVTQVVPSRLHPCRTPNLTFCCGGEPVAIGKVRGFSKAGSLWCYFLFSFWALIYWQNALWGRLAEGKTVQRDASSPRPAWLEKRAPTRVGGGE